MTELVGAINFTATVTFPGHKGVMVSFLGSTRTYGTANGDWLKVLEKAYGYTMWSEQGARNGKNFYDYINRGNALSAGIEVLTGDKTNTRVLSLTPIASIRQQLIAAFDNGTKTVTADVPGSDKKTERSDGLVGDHVYTVVDYNTTTDSVRLRNPWGVNPTFVDGTDRTFWLGKNDPDNPNPNTLPEGGNGYFWMSLGDFARKFDDICYEQ